MPDAEIRTAGARRPKVGAARLTAWAGCVIWLNAGMNREAIALLDLRPGRSVQETRFGPGEAIARLARMLGAGFVAGIDQSAAMIRLAARHNAAAIADGRVELREAWPFPAACVSGHEPD